MSGRRRSEILHRHRDPLTPHPGVLENNAAGAHGSNHWERGVVLEVDARRHSYRVHLDSGRTLSMGRLKTSPGDVGLLEVRTPVLVFFGLPVPYIWAILPLDAEHSDSGPTVSDESGQGGADPVLDRHLNASSRNPNDPTDLLPGDQTLQGPDGARVGALRGRIAQLYGGPLACIEAFGDGDRLRARCGEFYMSTWMGYSEYTNVNGKPAYKWRGGFDQMTQTGPSEQRFPISLDISEAVDGLKLEMKNTEGQAVFRLHVDTNGHGELFFAGGLAQTHGNRPGAMHATEHHGDEDHGVTGDSVRRVGGASRHTIEREWRVTSGSLTEIISGGAMNFTSVDDASFQTAGEMLLAAAKALHVVGDGVRFEPLTKPFEVATSLPDGVSLGMGAVSHGAKAEELTAVLTTILAALNSLRATFATHVHPGAALNPTYGSFTAPISVDMASFRSLVLRLR